jgi:hypothetical protein
MTGSELAFRPRARLIEVLDHCNLVPAINAFLRRGKPVLAAYILVNLLSFAVVVLWIRIGQAHWGDRLAYAGSGLAVGYLVLVPIHEAVHGLAYRICGAQNVRIHIRWRTLTAYCTADGFAISGKQFLLVCLAPFAVISPFLLMAGALLPKVAPLIGGALVLHTGACSGDFGMVALTLRHKVDSFWIYDSNGEGKTYIYDIPA